MSFLRLATLVRSSLPLSKSFSQGPPFLAPEFTGREKGKFGDRPDRMGLPDDYPDVPFVYYQDRPALGWMDEAGRRNLNTPLHEEDDLLSMWLFDRPPPRYTRTEQALQLFGALGELSCYRSL